MSLIVECVLLYIGFNFLLLGYMPLKHRLIGSAVFFPVAGLFAWWGGSLSVGGLPVEQRAVAKIIKTLPIVLLICVCLAAISFSILALMGVL
jgi:hypothetical protein